jgi:hypothetical protein
MLTLAGRLKMCPARQRKAEQMLRHFAGSLHRRRHPLAPSLERRTRGLLAYSTSQEFNLIFSTSVTCKAATRLSTIANAHRNAGRGAYRSFEPVRLTVAECTPEQGGNSRQAFFYSVPKVPRASSKS